MPTTNTTVEVNPYAALMQSEADRLTDRQRMLDSATDVQTAGTDGDQYAVSKRVAGFLGYPVAAVEATPKQSQQEFDRAKLINDTAQAPLLAKQYSDADFAKLAKGDSGALALFETLSNSFRRGVPGLQQNLSATALRANANTLGQLDSAQALLDAGKKNLTLEQDPQGVEFMTPEARRALREQSSDAAGDSAESIVARQAEKLKYPSPAVVQTVQQAKGFAAVIKAMMTDPVQFAASIIPESLV